MVQEDSFEQKIHLARTYRAAARYEKAVSIVKDILAEDPDHEMALYLLGCCEADLWHCDEARKILEPLGATGLAADAFERLGLMYFNCQQYEDAENFYRRVVEICPNSGVAHANLAMAQQRAFKKNLARALELSPDNPDVLRSAFLICHSNEHDTCQEEEYLQRMQEINAHPTWFPYFSGLTELKKKNYHEALACFRRAFQLNSHYTHFRDMIDETERRMAEEGKRPD